MQERVPHAAGVPDRDSGIARRIAPESFAGGSRAASAGRYSGVTCEACQPFSPCTATYSTSCPSSRER